MYIIIIIILFLDVYSLDECLLDKYSLDQCSLDECFSDECSGSLSEDLVYVICNNKNWIYHANTRTPPRCNQGAIITQL